MSPRQDSGEIQSTCRENPKNRAFGLGNMHGNWLSDWKVYDDFEEWGDVRSGVTSEDSRWVMQKLKLVLGLVVVLQAGILAADQQSQASYDSAAVAAAAGDASASVQASDPAGTWSGSWCSSRNGHHGPMRAEFCRTCDNQYSVRFRGKFWGIVPFAYRTTLQASTNADGTVTLTGSRRLGLLLGTFSMQATVTGNTLKATYCSKQDQGTFTMSRCGGCND